MSTVSIENVCRACLIDEGSFESLFAQDKDSGIPSNFAEMIMSYFSIQIFPGDGLPDRICLECSKKVLELYKFKLKCEESDLILKSRINLINPNILKDEVKSLYSLEAEKKVCLEELTNESIVCEFESILLEPKVETEQSESIDVLNDAVDKIKNELPECKVCNKRFSKLSNLRRHLLLHKSHRKEYVATESKPHKCSQCGKAYKFEKNLAEHVKIHVGIKPHVCLICSKGFNQRANLRVHSRIHNPKRLFPCETCGKVFNHLGNLRQHTLRHTGIRPYLCSFCGVGFACKGSLTRHIRTHTGVHTFICDLCNNGFTSSSSLRNHKRIHTGEKPYECEVCDMKFSCSSNLARHRKSHTGEKPHQCQICDKKFLEKNELRLHEMIHTGEKPFICEICGTAFRQRSALKYHIKTHQNKKRIDVCREVEAEPEQKHYCEVVKVENTTIEGL